MPHLKGREYCGEVEQGEFKRYTFLIIFDTAIVLPSFWMHNWAFLPMGYLGISFNGNILDTIRRITVYTQLSDTPLTELTFHPMNFNRRWSV